MNELWVDETGILQGEMRNEDIVLCCNTQPELLKALRKIATIERGCKKRGVGYDVQVHDIAKTAIALTKKKKQK